MAHPTSRTLKKIAITTATLLALAFSSSSVLSAQAEARIAATAYVVSAENTTATLEVSHQAAAELFSATRVAEESLLEGMRVQRHFGAAVVTAWMATEIEPATIGTVEMSGPWAHAEPISTPTDIHVLVEFAAN